MVGSSALLKYESSFVVPGATGSLLDFPSDSASAAFLANQRRQGNNSSFLFGLCDIELVSDGQCHYVHSAILAAFSHSTKKIISKLVPPFTWNLDGLSMESIRVVCDWIYFDETTFRSQDIYSHLMVTAFFEIPELQSLLERQLLNLARGSGNYVDVVLNSITDKRCKVSSGTSAAVWAAVQVSPAVLTGVAVASRLTPEAAHALLGRRCETVYVKLALLNYALKWLIKNRKFAVQLLPSIRHLPLSPETRERFLTQLLVALGSASSISVHSDARNNLEIVAFAASEQSASTENALVSYKASDTLRRTASTVSPSKPMELSPPSQNKARQHALPNVFANLFRNAEYTPSEIHEINNLPVAFSKREMNKKNSSLWLDNCDMVMFLDDEPPAFRCIVRHSSSSSVEMPDHNPMSSSHAVDHLQHPMLSSNRDVYNDLGQQVNQLSLFKDSHYA